MTTITTDRDAGPEVDAPALDALAVTTGLIDKLSDEAREMVREKIRTLIPAQLEIFKAELEAEIAREDFLFFLKFVKVQDPPPGLGIRPFEMWPYIEEAASELLSKKLIHILKARQIGWTTLLSAFIYWNSYKDYSVLPLFSQGEVEAQKFLGKIKIIHQYLPSDLVNPLKRGTRESLSKMEFENGSVIDAMPSTAKAGRSITGSVVVFDEADFHDYFEENYVAVKPTVDEGQRKLIILSTSNEKTIDSTFKKIQRKAPGNGFTSLFYPWNVRAGRTKEWFEGIKESAHDLGKFEKEYPETLEQALAPTKSLSAFNANVLTQLRAFTRTPLFRTPDPETGPVNVYYKIRPYGRYGCGTDVAHGGGGKSDFSCSTIIDFSSPSPTVVADILDNTLGPEALAWHTMTMLKMFNNPIWGIEDNDWGRTCIKAAEDQRYPRLYRRKKGRVKAKDFGWHTDGVSRWQLWGELIEATNAGLIIPSEAGLNQFFSVIINKEKNDRPEAMTGAKDDYPTAVGIAWQMRKYAHDVNVKGARIRKRW